MNKTVSVNISGYIFNIEEVAYHKLVQYLENIKAFYKGSEGADEIVADIEGRISELFQDILKENQQVITMANVDGVTEIMGNPEQYDDGDFFEDEPKAKPNSRARSNNSNRRVFRDPDNTTVAGVCSGLSHYFGWDPIVLRLIFLFSFLFAGTGLFIYIILWAVIPEARTTTEKLQMKGERVNAENIGKKVNEGVDSVKESFKKFADDHNIDGKNAGKNISTGLDKLFAGIGTFFSVIGKILVKFFGVIFVMFGIAILFGVLAGLVAADSFVFFDTGFTWDILSEQILMGDGTFTIATIATILILGSLVVGLLYSGFKILFNLKTSTKGLGIALFILFIIGTMMWAFAGIRIGREHRFTSNQTEILTTEANPVDTLYLNVLDDEYFNNKIRHGHSDFNELVKVDDGQLILGHEVRLSFDSSDKDYFEIVIEKESDGSSNLKGLEYIENIDFKHSMEDNLVSFSPVLKVPLDDKFHNQNVDITVYVPEGKYVQLDDNMSRIYWRSKYDGKLMTMINDDWDESGKVLDIEEIEEEE